MLTPERLRKMADAELVVSCPAGASALAPASAGKPNPRRRDRIPRLSSR